MGADDFKFHYFNFSNIYIFEINRKLPNNTLSGEIPKEIRNFLNLRIL